MMENDTPKSFWRSILTVGCHKGRFVEGFSQDLKRLLGNELSVPAASRVVSEMTLVSELHP
jgi:hypothetical protein